MEEYSLGRNAKIRGESLERNPFDKSSWRYKEWMYGWLDHKHRMDNPVPKLDNQRIKFTGL